MGGIKMRLSFSIASLALVFTACEPGVSFDTRSTHSTGALSGTIDQDIGVGLVRALVTNTIQQAFGLNACFDSASPTEILSSSAALAELASVGITKATSPQAAHVITELTASPSLTAVKIATYFGSEKLVTLWVPDANTDGLGFMFELVGPDAGETCVSCTNYVGQHAGPGCHCSPVQVRICGDNPSVSCTDECGWCPNGGGNPIGDAISICGAASIYSSTSSYTKKSPGSSL